MNELPRAARHSVALLVLAAILAAPAAHAQVPPPGVTVALDGTAIELGASNSTTVAGTVSYSDTAPALPGGATQANVDLTVTAPEGWTVTVEPASFALAPGQTADFTVTLVAPAAGEGAATGDAVVSAASAAAGGRSATSEATLALTRVDPAPVVIPWYQATLGIAGIVGAILLVAAVVGYVLWRRRATRLAAERAEAERAAYLARETGITLALAGGPLQYGHKREVTYRLAVTNASERPRVALLDVPEVTNGWRAATQVAKIPLSVGETVHATLVVTPDAVIKPGDKANLVVRVKPEEAREKDERLHLEVIAPKSGVPTDPHYRIVTVHREGA